MQTIHGVADSGNAATGAYAATAMRYLAAGFSPLPLPESRKEAPPKDWTGAGRPMASGADVAEWIAGCPEGNIALRLPTGVVGIDVDAYKGSAELAAWQELVARCGPLPDNAPWCSSRDDGVSGVRLFRVPDGYRAQERGMGSAGEVVQHHHRYVVAPPSIHPEGRPYRWVNGHAGAIPEVGKLPFLPLPWQQALRAGGQTALAVRGDTSWTSPDLVRLIAGEIPAGETQDAILRDVAFDLARQGMGETTAYAVWRTVADRLPLARPSEPWTFDDFVRHFRPAVAKLAADRQPESEAGQDKPGGGRKIRLTRASEIEPEPVVWAWEDESGGRLPAGALCLAAGREGTGKSSFAIWAAAQVTNGELPGSLFGRPRTVIFVTVEDSWSHTIVPRLIAAGADRTRVWRAEVSVDDSDEALTLSLPFDNTELERAVETTGAALVVIDPLMSAIGAGIDTHKNREVRKALDPLAGMADRTGAVFLGICHFGKSSSTDASSLITGSGAFKDVARAILAFADDGNGSRVLTQTKNSLGKGRYELPSLAYRTASALVETKSGFADVAKFVLEGQSDVSVDDILHGGESEDSREDQGEAVEWLTGYLMKHDGEAKAGDIIKAAERDGIAKRTIQRARKRAGVITSQSGFHGGWTWQLGTQSNQQAGPGPTGATQIPQMPSPWDTAPAAPVSPVSLLAQPETTQRDSGGCRICHGPLADYQLRHGVHGQCERVEAIEKTRLAAAS